LFKALFAVAANLLYLYSETLNLGYTKSQLFFVVFAYRTLLQHSLFFFCVQVLGYQEVLINMYCRRYKMQIQKNPPKGGFLIAMKR